FAYNGEARDITGLDYLRARYYDNQVGTFLTEDSYQGDNQDPLSQNLYSYVQNNPVNYTDPSGHFWKKLVQGAKKTWNNVKKVASNT
ncbi:RHS repeat-associated core domain-containing protein, partial [Streptococcus pyogenes]